MVWLPGTNTIAVAAASSILLVNASSGRQSRALLGHTAYVSALAVGGDGGLLASCQEGRHPVIRLWDIANGDCLAILCGAWAGWLGFLVVRASQGDVAEGYQGRIRQRPCV